VNGTGLILRRRGRKERSREKETGSKIILVGSHGKLKKSVM
jgi:hypothetical protein